MLLNNQLLIEWRVTLAFISDLIVAFVTGAAVASLGVDAVLLAQVLTGCALIQVPTRLSVRI